MRVIRNMVEVISETQKIGSTLYKASKKSDIKQIIWHKTISYLLYPLTLPYNDLFWKSIYVYGKWYVYNIFITNFKWQVVTGCYC